MLMSKNVIDNDVNKDSPIGLVKFGVRKCCEINSVVFDTNGIHFSIER